MCYSIFAGMYCIASLAVLHRLCDVKGVFDMPDDYRIVRHPEFDGLNGEFELQWEGPNGFENVAYSHDLDALVRFANGQA